MAAKRSPARRESPTVLEVLRRSVAAGPFFRGLQIDLGNGGRVVPFDPEPGDDPARIKGIAYGTEPYTVETFLDRTGDARVRCTCPNFVDYEEPCKHTVALILQAARLRGWPGSRPLRRVVGDADIVLVPRAPAVRATPQSFAHGDAWRSSLARPAPSAPVPLVYAFEGRSRFDRGREAASITLFRPVEADRGPLALPNASDAERGTEAPASLRLLKLATIVPERDLERFRPRALGPLDDLDATLIEALASAWLHRYSSGFVHHLAAHVLRPAAIAGRLHTLLAKDTPGPAYAIDPDAVWRCEARLAADPEGFARVHARLVGDREDGTRTIVQILEKGAQRIGSLVVLPDRLVDLVGPARREHPTFPPAVNLPGRFDRMLDEGPVRIPAAAESALLKELRDGPWAMSGPEHDRSPFERFTIDVAVAWTIDPEFSNVLGIRYFDAPPHAVLRLEGAPERTTADVRPLARFIHPEDPGIVRERDLSTGELLESDSPIHAGVIPRYSPIELRSLAERAHRVLRAARGHGARGWRVPRSGIAKLISAAAKQGFAVEWIRTPTRAGRSWGLSVRSGIDWFDLDGHLVTDQGRIPLHELVGAARRQPEAIELLSLDDGTSVAVPAKLQRVLRRLARIWNPKRDETTLRFDAAEAGLVETLLSEADRRSDDVAFRRARDRLLRSDAAPVDPGPDFRGALRPYQRIGLGWLLRHAEGSEKEAFGGCLADEMGLGKTVQVLAMLDLLRAGAPRRTKRPSLLVAPRSLVRNWCDEAARFTPQLRVADFSQPDRSLDESAFRRCHLAIVTYGTLVRDAAILREREFEWVILDEAQTIKNAATSASLAAKSLKARRRLAITGTPVENHPAEFWSILGFVHRSLADRLRAIGGSSDEQLTLVRSVASPFLLRRTKREVAPDLPARIEQVLRCDLIDGQRSHYEALLTRIRADFLAGKRRLGLDRVRLEALQALLRLRQAACHPGLVDRRRRAAGSGKIDALFDLVEEGISEDRKTLVFSQFTSFLDIVRERLDRACIAYEYLDGGTSGNERAKRVARFSKPDGAKLFLLSLKAGGVGLNLQAADRVILLDPWWNPAVEAQAIDRAHRIGQTRPVHAIRLVSADTVEERVLELQERKRRMAAALLDGSDPAAEGATDLGPIAALTAEDLEFLIGEG
jgi:superfamily II DNA or RNA helicase